MDQEKIGVFISTLRKEQGMTQQQLADAIGVSNKTISKVMQFAFGNENLYKATVEVTSVIPANSEYFDLYREQLPDLAPLVDYLETSQPFAYPTQSKKFADRLISLMQEALMNEESTLTGQEIVTQLAEEFGNK